MKTKEFKIYGRCYNCKRNKFFVRTRRIKLPMGLFASSWFALCGECHKALIEATKQPPKHD